MRTLTDNLRQRLHLLAFIGIILVLAAIAMLWSNNVALRRELQEARLANQQLAQTQSPSCRPRYIWQAGASQRFSIESDGLQRSYRVHLPKDFKEGTYYPVVFGFNGKGETAEQFEQFAGLNALPAVIVYPEPLVTPIGTTAWQGAPYSGSWDDVEFVERVSDAVEANLCIDRSKRFVVGWSNGGGFTWLLSCQASDRFTGFAMVAGAFYYPEEKCQNKIFRPTINIHAVDDLTVPYHGSLVRGLPDIDDWMKQRMTQAACTDSTQNSHPGAHIYIWRNCKDGAVFQNVTLARGGHSWQLTLQSSPTDPDSLDTAQIIWRFLRTSSEQ